MFTCGRSVSELREDMAAVTKLPSVCVVLVCLWGVAAPGPIIPVDSPQVEIKISGPPALVSLRYNNVLCLFTRFCALYVLHY